MFMYVQEQCTGFEQNQIMETKQNGKKSCLKIYFEAVPAETTSYIWHNIKETISKVFISDINPLIRSPPSFLSSYSFA